MLRQLFGIDRKTSLPEADKAPFSEISYITSAAQEDYVDIEGLARDLGIEVNQYPYRSDLAGTLQRFSSEWVIGVNSADSENRKRFTIAHEIGHYIYHRDLIALRIGTAGTTDTHNYRQLKNTGLFNPHLLDHHESQANRVAINILMNENKMHRLVAKGLSVEDIAKRIGCSVDATSIRLRGIKSNCAHAITVA